MPRPQMKKDPDSRLPSFRAFKSSPIRDPRQAVRGLPRASTPGSIITMPRHTPSKAVMSGSEIPRKPISTARDTSTPQAQAAGKSSGPSSSSRIPKPKLKHLDHEKPLPSPPVLQIVNSSSPPKAQRTLIDADVVGTPSLEDWPILSPYGVQSGATNLLETPMVASGVDELVQQGAQNSKGQDELATLQFNPILSSPTECSSTELLVDLSDSSSTVVHAITTPHNEALESPFAHKLAILPRVSSKRSSLPVSRSTAESTILDANEPEAVHEKEAQPGDTKWPVLDTQHRGASERTSRQPGDTKTELISKDGASSACQDASESKVYNQSDSTNNFGTESISGFDTGSEYSVDEFEADDDIHSYNRITRLSGHTVNSGLGPILKIANDADNVLLGDKSSVSSSVNLEKAPRERQSMTSFADKMARQTFSRLSGGMNSRSESSPLIIQETNSKETANSHPAEPASSGDKFNKDISPKDLSSPLPLPENHWYSKVPLRYTPGSVRTTPRSVTSPLLQKPVSGLSSGSNLWKDNAERGGKGTPNGPTPTGARKKVYTRPSPFGPEREKVSAIPQGNASLNKLRRDTAPTRASPSNLQDPKANGRSPPASSPRIGQPSKAKDHSVSHHPAHGSRNVKATASKQRVASNKIEPKRGKPSKDTSNVDPDDDSGKIKSKRSLRNLFHIRDLKAKIPPVPSRPKRASLTSGNPLKKHFRNSTGPLKPGARVERDAAPTKPSTPNEENIPATCSDTATIVSKIVSQVSLLPETSADRLRGLEIAEAVLNSYDAYKNAQISATEAQKHARQAELNAQRASVELARIQQLCGPDLDPATAEAVKVLVKSVSPAGNKHSTQLGEIE